ncbi:hypothetical protein D9758_014051 [Tetrapyrgos nigripes]|uniref:Uncharacterized protein n=1 Tax=Tetrapyrgos nigripes TaxID=182062 RepID=A0A8H5FLG3_9AGAR|nr:hypothetical protein D9758_014051 [Tetrapyrgos nigripes]
MTATVTFILDSQDLQPLHVEEFSFNDSTGKALDPPDVFRLNSNNTPDIPSGLFYQDSLLFFNGSAEQEYTIDFDGSSISLFGYALGEVSKNFTVDASSVQPNIFQNPMDLPALTGGQFPSSSFQGRIGRVQQMSIDYALVTATNTSNLEDKIIFVDDDDAEITWSGWTRQAARSYGLLGVMYVQGNASRNSPSLIVGQPIEALPNGNSVHQSDVQDDSFVFKFAGKSILVGGFTPGTPDQGPLTSPGPSSALTMNFDVDGNSTLKTYFAPVKGFKLDTSLNYVYFSNPDLPAGNHTLNVTIHSVSGNISAYIDYITYKPIFSTLVDKPEFSDPDPTTSSSPEPNQGDPGPSRSHVSAAVIVGATVGSLLLITILITALWFFNKRKNSKQHRLLGIHEDNVNELQVEPFTTPVSLVNQHTASGSEGTGKNRRPTATQDVTTNCHGSVPIESSDTSNVASNIIPPNSVTLSGESSTTMAVRMLGMEARIEMMSREMQQYIAAPPAYISQSGSIEGEADLAELDLRLETGRERTRPSCD